MQGKIPAVFPIIKSSLTARITYFDLKSTEDGLSRHRIIVLLWHSVVAVQKHDKTIPASIQAGSSWHSQLLEQGARLFDLRETLAGKRLVKFFAGLGLVACLE